MNGESLKQLGEAVQEALRKGANAPGCEASLPVYDLSRLAYIVRCYGGVAGWQPTPENIEKLAPAVRRHLRRLEGRIAELERRR